LGDKGAKKEIGREASFIDGQVDQQTEVVPLQDGEKKPRLRKVKKLPKGMEMPLEEMIEIAGSKKKKE